MQWMIIGNSNHVFISYAFSLIDVKNRSEYAIKRQKGIPREKLALKIFSTRKEIENSWLKSLLLFLPVSQTSDKSLMLSAFTSLSLPS